MSLRSRWFPTEEEERLRLVEETQELEGERERIGIFLDLGYTQDVFLPWLRAEALIQEPQPGEKEAMLYQCGVRDGLRKVEIHLAQLDRFRKER